MSECFQPEWISPPGSTLIDMMIRKGLSASKLADALGINMTAVRGLISGTQRVDTATATLLAAVVGGSVAFWLARQAAFDSALDRLTSKISESEANNWLNMLPTKDAVEYGWLSNDESRENILKSYLAFFNVLSPTDWATRCHDLLGSVVLRTTKTFQAKLGATSAWLRQAEIEASLVQTATWSRENLEEAVPQLRRLTRNKQATSFIPQLRNACAEAGVALVFVPAPDGCRASGAARFVSARKAMIALSFRYLSDDHFWFSFFHEIGHLLLHGSTGTFIEGDESFEDAREEEANVFSQSTLIPPDRYEDFLDVAPRRDDVIRFAVSIGTSPGIVVGQLQHANRIGPHQLNYMKKRYVWKDIAPALN